MCVRSFLTCKRNVSTVQQVMSDLLRERLIPYHHPFTHTGMDFFGPFYVRRGRSAVKVYGCIFVCYNSRAVHVEDVSSLETDSFILALRYFISVRGCPKEIWSDNGTNFTGAENKLCLPFKTLMKNISRESYTLHPQAVGSNMCCQTDVSNLLLQETRQMPGKGLFEAFERP